MSEEVLRRLARRAAKTGDERDLIALGLQYLRTHGYRSSLLTKPKVFHWRIPLTNRDWWHLDDYSHLTRQRTRGEEPEWIFDLPDIYNLNLPADEGSVLWRILDFVTVNPEYSYLFIEPRFHRSHSVIEAERNDFGYVELVDIVSDEEEWLGNYYRLHGIMGSGTPGFAIDVERMGQFLASGDFSQIPSIPPDRIREAIEDAYQAGMKYVIFNSA